MFSTLDGHRRRPILPFWQSWTQFGLSPRQVAWISSKARCKGVFIGLQGDRMLNGGSNLQAGVEVYHWGYLPFWLTLGNQNDALLGPQISPPRVANWLREQLGPAIKGA